MLTALYLSMQNIAAKTLATVFLYHFYRLMYL